MLRVYFLLHNADLADAQMIERLRHILNSYSQTAHCVSITKTIQLMLYMKIITVSVRVI
jgi:hypothetical protein